MIRNIKFDKITVWDSGHADKGTATANFMSSIVKSLPPLHDVAKLAGVDLPEYLGSAIPTSSAQPKPTDGADTPKKGK